MDYKQLLKEYFVIFISLSLAYVIWSFVVFSLLKSPPGELEFDTAFTFISIWNLILSIVYLLIFNMTVQLKYFKKYSSNLLLLGISPAFSRPDNAG